jgi:hypothetical protein
MRHEYFCSTLEPGWRRFPAEWRVHVGYLLPYAQFLYAEKISNPALEKEPDAPPEKMLIRFATAEVVVLGSGLKRLEQGIQKYELKFVKSADRRLAATLSTHVASVAINLIKEKI